MLKMVVGGEPTRTWKDDVRRVRAAREAIGPDVDLMIDANCWFNPHDALMLAKGVEDLNLRWFEEPIQQNDARALADLRNRTSVPIAAGQMEGHRWRFRELVIHHAVDVLQPNVLYNGATRKRSRWRTWRRRSTCRWQTAAVRRFSTCTCWPAS